MGALTPIAVELQRAISDPLAPAATVCTLLQGIRRLVTSPHGFRGWAQLSARDQGGVDLRDVLLRCISGYSNACADRAVAATAAAAAAEAGESLSSVPIATSTDDGRACVDSCVCYWALECYNSLTRQTRSVRDKEQELSNKHRLLGSGACKALVRLLEPITERNEHLGVVSPLPLLSLVQLLEAALCR